MKNVKIFKNMEEYENWTDKFENCYEYDDVPTIVDDGWKIMIDMMTECKTYKTALRRFEKAFKDYDKSIEAWVEGMKESCEYGFFKDTCIPSWDASEEEKKAFNEFGSYGWEIEEVDEGRWYIFLNISGEYADRKRA